MAEVLDSVVDPAQMAPIEETAPAPQTEELVIRARHGWIGIDWAELVRYRELLYFLVWRDLKVRYKQTVLGVAWVVLQPVLMMLVFTVIFGVLLGVSSGEQPYAVFVYAALLPWTFFSSAVSLGGLSLVSQQHLLTKIYFPRLFVPTASVGAGLVDLAISFGVYAIILAIYGVVPSWQVVMLPVLVLLTVMVTLGFSYLLAALTVTYRDFRYVIPFMLQAMMYLSPVMYPTDTVPERFHVLWGINPMAGIIDGYRAAILGTQWNWSMLGVSALATTVLFIFSLFYFRKTERRFADIA